MSMVLINQWLDEVMPSVPGCIELVALNAIYRSIVDFSERSEAWRMDLAPIAVTSLNTTYPLTSLIPANTIITNICYASFLGKPLEPTSPRALDMIDHHWRTKVGTPTKFYADEELANIILYPAPSLDWPAIPGDTEYDDGGSGQIYFLEPSLIPTVALRFDEVQPSQLMTLEVDQSLWRWYKEAITWGALHRLLEMPKKPWTDYGLATLYRTRFQESSADALARAESGFVRGPVRTRAVNSIER